jgi:hypothetical protein
VDIDVFSQAQHAVGRCGLMLPAVAFGRCLGVTFGEGSPCAVRAFYTTGEGRGLQLPRTHAYGAPCHVLTECSFLILLCTYNLSRGTYMRCAHVRLRLPTCDSSGAHRAITSYDSRANIALLARNNPTSRFTSSRQRAACCNSKSQNVSKRFHTESSIERLIRAHCYPHCFWMDAP